MSPDPDAEKAIFAWRFEQSLYLAFGVAFESPRMGMVIETLFRIGWSMKVPQRTRRIARWSLRYVLARQPPEKRAELESLLAWMQRELIAVPGHPYSMKN